MEIRLLDLCGFYSAAYGARLSYSSTDKMDTQPGTVCGEKDTELLKKLVLRGSDHAKSVRMIHISASVKASAKFFSQFDTYKVGTVSSSSSQMHTILKDKITTEMFVPGVSPKTIEYLEELRQAKDFTTLIKNIPQGFIYERVIDLNYQVLRAIYFGRRNHRWYEWKEFCDWVETLPLSQELITATKIGS